MSDDDAEVVDALPVLADEQPRGRPDEARLPMSEARPSRSLLPDSPVAVTAAAVAATGFVACAATIALATRRHRAAKVTRRPKGLSDQILGTRSYRVDVHLLDR